MIWKFEQNRNNEKHIPLVEEVCSWLPAFGGRVERILLLSDIHANWHALTSVLKHARDAYNAIWFLGDICDYGPRPVECMMFLKKALSRRGRWVLGNHDLALVGKLKEVDLSASLNSVAAKTLEKHRDALQKHPTLWDWCYQNFSCARSATGRELTIGPKIRRYGGYTQMFVHATPDTPVSHYLSPSDHGNLFYHLNALLKRNGHGAGAWLLGGHTHMVTLAQLPARYDTVELLPITYGIPIPIGVGAYYINPGSVGQPRDGDPRAAYAILDVLHGTVTYSRVEYAVLDAQLEMCGAGYPNELIERLSTARGGVTERYYDPVYTRWENGVRVHSNS